MWGASSKKNPESLFEERKGMIVYKRTSYSSNMKSLEIVCSPKVTLFSGFDTRSNFKDRGVDCSASSDESATKAL